MPILAKYITNIGCVVDIGANVGDTLAGMVNENSELKYICIEADDYFYNCLINNIERIQTSHKNLKVDSFHNFIGDALTNVNLEGTNGTKRAMSTLGLNGILSISLDKLLSKINYPKVGLLKTDVDGFDYDVLNSSISTIKKDGPIIFFELYFEILSQKKAYIKTIKSLRACGYCDWTIFDNFGGILVRQTKDINVIFQLIEYLSFQNNALFSRTIYYFDVLAAQQKDVKIIAEAIDDYYSFIS